ncbi:MAG: glycerol-3-phosphate dehydrogenase [Gammaproteobacteria bacterium]
MKIDDLLVIGGGINGAGIAADAAGRGLSVTLCEQNDLASGTSSASTKLIHGGLRYLEQGEFGLVHEALNEREVLMAKAPHLISPLSFVIPYQKQLRPRWLIQLGLWIYDHLGQRVTLPKSRRLRFKDTPYGAPLKPSLTDGFIYSDCWVDDARLVLANALAAQALGARIFTYTEVTNTVAMNGIWHVTVYDKMAKQLHTLYAKALVKATGPWMDDPDFKLELVKGSHIIVRETYPGTHAYLIQHTDNRVIFVIPYEHDYTLIGTTDLLYHGTPNHVEIDAVEKNYLIDAYNQYFQKSLSVGDIVADYSGIRPLVDSGKENPSETSREYTLAVKEVNHAALLAVFGGKITTYRTLAEHAMDALAPFFPNMKPAWTKNAPLPGGNIRDFNAFMTTMADRYPFLSRDEITRLAHLYGTQMEQLLEGVRTKTDLGEYFGAGCYERELKYAIQHEWVKKPEDFLYRRTKLYLSLTPDERRRVEQWFHDHPNAI